MVNNWSKTVAHKSMGCTVLQLLWPDDLRHNLLDKCQTKNQELEPLIGTDIHMLVACPHRDLLLVILTI